MATDAGEKQMIFSTVYNDQNYRTEADNFSEAQDVLEEDIGRPLPDQSVITCESTGETKTVGWTIYRSKSTGSAVGLLTSLRATSTEQMDAFAPVLQCDLFGANE
jgi:hypothetical protein